MSAANDDRGCPHCGPIAEQLAEQLAEQFAKLVQAQREIETLHAQFGERLGKLEADAAQLDQVREPLAAVIRELFVWEPTPEHDRLYNLANLAGLVPPLS